MTLGKQADCGCDRKARTTASQLGLDELMIVNPAPGDTGGMFLGDDGTLYHVHGSSEGEHLFGLGQLFLGDDGSLYRAETSTPSLAATPTASSSAGAGATSELDGYLLAADGTLYEVTK